MCSIYDDTSRHPRKLDLKRLSPRDYDYVYYHPMITSGNIKFKIMPKKPKSSKQSSRSSLPNLPCCKCCKCNCHYRKSDNVSSDAKQATETKEGAKEQSAVVPEESNSLKVSEDINNIDPKSSLYKGFKPVEKSMAKSSEQVETNQAAATADKQDEKNSGEPVKRMSGMKKMCCRKRRDRHRRRLDLMIAQRLVERYMDRIPTSSSSESD